MPTVTDQNPQQPRLPEFHPDELFLDQSGGVQRHVNWVCWNGENWPTIDISRQPDGSFVAHISDPEHGGGTARGTFEQATAGLHPEVVAKYRALFDLQNPTALDVAAVGFDANTVISSAK